MITQFPELTSKVNNTFQHKNITDLEIQKFIVNKRLNYTFNQLSYEEQLYYIVDIPPVYHKPDINDTFITYMTAIIREIISSNNKIKNSDWEENIEINN